MRIRDLIAWGYFIVIPFGIYFGWTYGGNIFSSMVFAFLGVLGIEMVFNFVGVPLLGVVGTLLRMDP